MGITHRPKVNPVKKLQIKDSLIDVFGVKPLHGG